MINLIKIELFKEFKTKRFYIMLLLIMIVSILSVIIVDKRSNYINEEKVLIVEEKLDEKSFYDLYRFSDYENYLLQYDNYVNIMKEEIKISNENSEIFKFTNTALSIQVFLGIVIVIISGTIVSNEFSKGTIKHLLSKYSRKKVLFSKYLTVLILILIFNFVLLLSITTTSLFVSESNIFTLTQSLVKNGAVFKTNAYLVFLSKFLFYMIPLIFIGTMSFCLSAVSNSTALSTTLSIIVVLSGSFISQVCFGFNILFLEYTFLPYVDYTIFIDKVLLISNNMELGVNLNIKSATIILIVYTCIFYLISHIVFCKKDIKVS